MLIDSHCHLDRLKLSAYDGQLSGALRAARDAGVDKILCVSTDMARLKEMMDLVYTHPGVYGSVGVHPMSEEVEAIDKDQLVAAAQDEKVIAIGETGLDYYYQPESAEAQQRSFIHHLRASSEVAKPVIVHTRDAREDTLDIIRRHGDAEVGGVLHCFTESWEMARAAIEMNYWVSFSGIITFNNAAPLREVVKQVPLDRLLVETDAPYLTPAPYRGKPNEPRYVARVAQCVAEIKGLTYEAVVEATTDNFYRLFTKA